MLPVSRLQATTLLVKLRLPRCLPRPGYHAARQRGAVAVTRPEKIRGDATTLLDSVGRWSASVLNPEHHPTLASNAVMKPSLLRGWFRLSSHVGKQHGNDGLCFAMVGIEAKPSTEAKCR
jgi:hypothetical protein